MIRNQANPISRDIARSIVNVWTLLDLFRATDPGLWYDPHMSRYMQLPTGWGADYVGVSDSRLYYDILPYYLGVSPSIGAELLTNGDFNAATGWSLGAGWSISGGQALQSGPASASNLSRGVAFVAGGYYELEIDCALASASALVPLVGSGGRAFNVTSADGGDGRLVTAGAQKFIARYSGSGSLFLQAQTGFVGTLDGASLKLISGGGYHGIADSIGVAPSYAAGRLTFAGSDTLKSSVPDMGTDCTTCYVNDSGVTYLEGQTISGVHSTPLDASWYSCLVIGRALTPSEKSSLTQFMLARRRTILRDAIAVWGDSMAGGSGSTSVATQWSTLLQYLFATTRDRVNFGTGGHTSAQVRAVVEADTIYTPLSVNILFDKRNYEETVSAWLDNTAATLARFTSGRFIVMSCTTGAGEGIGTDYYNEALTINSALASTYPNNYLDIRSYLIADGLADAGITPTAQDLLDVADDTIPDSLRADTVHLNNAGQALVAQQVYEFLSAKGW